MRKLKRFENYSQDLPDQTSPKLFEEDDEFVITKIIENFPFDEVKSRIEDESEDDKETLLLDMIVWFRNEYKREIKNEDHILSKLREKYNIN